MVITGKISDDYHRILKKLGLAEPRHDLVQTGFISTHLPLHKKSKKVDLNKAILTLGPEECFDLEDTEIPDFPDSCDEHTDIEVAYNLMREQNVEDYNLIGIE